jgi:hypothetical protein
MRHEPSLDQEVGLWRGASKDLREVAADAFASEFLLPRWLYIYHARRHQWTTDVLRDPAIVYQLSLRVGASYEATCWGLGGHGILTRPVVSALQKAEPKEIKQKTLAGSAELVNPWANVWVITEDDDGLTFEGAQDDVIVFRCAERSSAGYLWDASHLHDQGFELLRDAREIPDEGQCGVAATRVLVTRVGTPRQYHVTMVERRPWDPQDAARSLAVSFELFGKEDGLPRVARKALAAA